MKRLPLIALVLFLWLPRTANASDAELRCELIDLVTQRIVDAEVQTINVDSARTILMLLRYNDLTGTVHDALAPGGIERILDLQLYYRVGASHGEARASTAYQLDRQDGNQALARVSLETPDVWHRPIELRCFARPN